MMPDMANSMTVPAEADASLLPDDVNIALIEIVLSVVLHESSLYILSRLLVPEQVTASANLISVGSTISK